MRRHKYNAKAQVVDGIRFASKRESIYYLQLKALLKTGRITDLELQPRFPMPPYGGWMTGETKARPVVAGEICTYVADFLFKEKGKTVVVDVKGMKTPVYKLKRRLLNYFYPDVEVTEA